MAGESCVSGHMWGQPLNMYGGPTQLILQGVPKPSGKMQPTAKETGPGLAMEDSEFWLSFPRLLDAPGQ